MRKIWELLTYGLSRRVWTFSNGIALFMLVLGLAVEAYPNQGTAAYFNVFGGGFIPVRVMGAWMLVSAILLAFRRLNPIALFLAALPLIGYGFVVAYVSLIPVPPRPLTPAIGWGGIAALIIFYVLEKTDVHRD